MELRQDAILLHGVNPDGAASTTSIEFAQIKKIEVRTGFIWSTILIRPQRGQKYLISGLPKARASRFFLESTAALRRHELERLKAAQKRLISEHWDELIAIVEQLREFSSGRRYAPNNAKRRLLDSIRSVEICLSPERIGLMENPNERAILETIAEFRRDHDKLIKLWNEQFIRLEQERFKELFDSIEAHPLTRAQREAIVTSEDNNLVIAAAGSGKTSVIVAKAAYLLKKSLCKPHEILLLSYSNDSAKELRDRIKQVAHVKVKTFHALGLEIIGQVEGRRPGVSELATDEKKMPAKIHELITELFRFGEFVEAFLTYFQSYFAIYLNLFDFKNWGEYYDYLKSHEIRTLKGDLVKSYEECEISNFLYLNGIDYEYERDYEVDTRTREKPQYKPDFYLTDYGIYIEHFALNALGNTPSFIDRQKYRDDMQWKRDTHAKNETILIETFSYEKDKGTLLTGLQEKLKKYEVQFTPISHETVFTQLKELGKKVNLFSRLVATFLNHFKSNQHTIEALLKKAENYEAKTHPDVLRLRTRTFLHLFERIYQAYERHLINSKKIDFHDMINKATEYVAQGRYTSPYSFILVDEFQDISIARARLIQALAEQRSTNVLFCVGDDWQAIYRFAGSDIPIMRNFRDHFGYTQTLYLDQTFRFTKQIAEVSTKFILRNPNQIEKEISTHRDTTAPCIFIGRYIDNEHDLVKDALEQISKQVDGQSNSVLILGRYNKPIESEDLRVLANQFPKLSIQFMTVHKAKGLEADFVIIVGLQAGRYGFPSEIVDDPIIDLVLAEREDYAHAEERRLFYVAMTRAREAVYLLSDSRVPSCFITELESDDYTVELFGAAPEVPFPCMSCKTGKLIRREGRDGPFYGCSNYPYCNFTYDCGPCPKCGHELRPTGDASRKLVCVNDKCRYEEQACPSCGTGRLKSRTGPNGPFMGCSNYPDCRYTRNATPSI